MEIPKAQQNIIEFAEQGKIKNGILVMPTLYSMDTHGKIMVWTIYIGINDPKKKQINVTQDYIEQNEYLPSGAIGTYWTIYGREDGKISVSEKTNIYSGKNLGRKNETTPFTQAILDARTNFNKKIRHGSKRNPDFLKDKDHVYTFEELYEDESRGEYPWRVFAMAMHDFKKFSSKITFPATIQYKLDGVLFVVACHPDLKAGVDGYSRGRETLEGYDHILKGISKIAGEFEGLHFVGEIWKEGYGLQELSGLARRKADSPLEQGVKLNYNIFDCFYIDKPELGFSDRQKILDDVFSYDLNKYIVRVPTHTVNSLAEAKKIYRSFISKKIYEGAVIRNMDAPYEFGINKEIRSYQSLKLKPRFDAEWPIVGFTDGKGKEVGLVTWVCAENDAAAKNTKLEDRATFNVTPNQQSDLRKLIFTKLSTDPEFFKKEVYGQLAVISYSILSEAGLPQQPKMLRFRDPKIDIMLTTTED